MAPLRHHPLDSAPQGFAVFARSLTQQAAAISVKHVRSLSRNCRLVLPIKQANAHYTSDT